MTEIQGDVYSQVNRCLSCKDFFSQYEYKYIFYLGKKGGLKKSCVHCTKQVLELREVKQKASRFDFFSKVSKIQSQDVYLSVYKIAAVFFGSIGLVFSIISGIFFLANNVYGIIFVCLAVVSFILSLLFLFFRHNLLKTFLKDDFLLEETSILKS